ncbi:hypothetical protein BAUCODRAFT_70218 [Baudoinia panamericana UAMH 10762]|uniref:Mso1 N-terminal domain-containing protein n=1 Tax=Baudoinia panamericana (strain UAMH 10762) TaxID=717646 RepID=M2MIR2_BAUPA|nr:uncharacterized protein BAUCODRAFT_70218 [Baudoinia panamericana UAMH 10762]EMC96541.1 hypothetical protein BAUCODRAFT_70218 [Baudoinia panamericana UAMH 10762]
MSSYLSNLLTQTTSKYNSLRRTLLSNEEDGDTEDDSHIARVLRAYYTEKGRPFPPWLPPDPNDKRAVTPQPHAQQNNAYFTSATAKSQYTSIQNQPGARGSLSDLWDTPAQTVSPAQPQSLRAGRRPMPTAASTSASSTLAPPAQARPLPSQKLGSYQNMQSQRPALDQSPPSSSSGGSSAQDRLKARLWGGSRGGTPASNSTGSPGLSQVGSPNPYEQSSTGSNAPYGGSNSYDMGSNAGRRYGRPG